MSNGKFGAAVLSSSVVVAGHVLGGLVTGSSGEFLSLPVSGGSDKSDTSLIPIGMSTNEWSRFYLSDSFGDASGSVIQALNYLSASLNASSGDVNGPGSSTDNAIVRFDGTTGKVIQNTSVTTITDAGNIATEGSVSGASTLAGISLAMGDNADEFTVSRLGRVQGGTGGNLYDLRADGFISGASSLHGNNLLVQSASIALEVSGGTLDIGGGDFTVSNLGAVAGGAGGDSYALTAAGALSGASSITAGSSITATTSISGGTLNVGGGDFTVSNLGAVAGGAGGDSYSLAANGAISGANSLTVGTSIAATTSISGGTLAIGGDEFTVSNAGAIAGGSSGDSYAISAAGAISGAAQITAGTTIAAVSTITAGTQLNAGTNVSGVGSLLGAQVSVGNGAGQISQAGAFVGSSFQGQTFQGSSFKAFTGAFSGTVDAALVASNTGSAGANNYKAALVISSSDIQEAGDAGLIPRMVMQGTNEAGALTDFMVSVSGGMLQVVELTYGTALPI